MPSLARTSAFALLASTQAARVSRHSAGVRDGYTPYENKWLFTLTPCTAEELEDLQAYLEKHECLILDDELSLPKDGCADSMAVCKEESDARALETRFPESVQKLSEDAAGYFRKTSGTAQGYVSVAAAELSSDFYSRWRTLEARMARVEAAVAASNGAAVIEVAGQSHEGRDIKLVRFRGSGFTPGGPRAVFTFNLHAREWIAGMAGVYAVEKFCDLVKSNPSVIAGMEVVMVPMANPDGFYYSETESRFHRKNTNGVEDAGWFCTGGVDLNRNFNSSWSTAGSSGNRCSDTYHGPAPESEKETQVLKSIQTESQMTVFIDVHAFTELILWSWGHTRDDHPRQAEFKALGEQMKAAVDAKHGRDYTAGAIAQTLYAAAGGIEDYATVLGALGYCYELRPKRGGQSGFAPPEDQILPSSEECYEGLLVAVNYVRNQ